MNISQLIEDNFDESIDVITKSKTILNDKIALCCKVLFTTLEQKNKILCCGNGGSAADSQHFIAELVNRFENERVELPGIALTTDTSIITAIANDYSFEDVFSKQISALGKKGDCLIAISTSGNSPNIIKAIKFAHDRGMSIIALTGKNGGDIAKILTSNDIELRVPSDRTCRIQEVHELILHIMCTGIDQLLLNTGEN